MACSGPAGGCSYSEGAVCFYELSISRGPFVERARIDKGKRSKMEISREFSMKRRRTNPER